MKKFTAVAVASFCCLAGAVLAQTAVHVFQQANVVVDSIHLIQLDDGGCAATWVGRAVADDGTQQVFNSSRQLAAPGNQNKCNTLLSAGATAIAKEAAIIADAGAL